MAKTKSTHYNDEIDQLDLSTIGDINETNLFGEDGEVSCLAGEYGRVSDLLLSVTQDFNKAKTALDQLEGKIDGATRQAAELSGAKVTEAKIKGAVHASQPYVVSKTALDEVAARVAKCQAVLKTMAVKEHMLDLLGRFQIRELGVTSRTQ